MKESGVRYIKIAMCGEQNVGKSSTINKITKSNLDVGNFAGVTVDKAHIAIQTERKGKKYILEFIDLPGINCLIPHSDEQKITSDFLSNKDNYDIILGVFNATQLENDFHLFEELVGLKAKLLPCFNMIDELAHKEDLSKLEKDLNDLSEKFHTKFAAISAKTGFGIEKLLDSIIELDEQEKPKPADELIFYKTVVDHCKSYRDALHKSHRVTYLIDNILLNKFLGLPIFLFIMWNIFQLSFKASQIPVDILDSFSSISEVWFTKSLPGFLDLASLLACVSSSMLLVVSFIPTLAVMFLLLAIIEKSGYIVRVSFLLDGILQKFHIHGKAFIPLMLGFGCSIPAYISSRIMKNYHERIAVMIGIGFMSCSAKLIIYTMLIQIFFPVEYAGTILFAIHFLGVMIGLIIIKLSRQTFLQGESEMLVMEMPRYRMPGAGYILFYVWEKIKHFLKNIGGIIFVSSIILWVLSNYPNYGGGDPLIRLENSFLGMIGQATEFIFRPIGLDWKMSIALEAGLAGKEMVVATMNVLYSAGQGGIHAIASQISSASALSFMIFCLLYLPCISATITFAKEAKSKKYVIILIVLTTVIAWLASFITYQIVS